MKHANNGVVRYLAHMAGARRHTPDVRQYINHQ